MDFPKRAAIAALQGALFVVIIALLAGFGAALAALLV
jgi:hypothetical protein